jgi:putative transposase
MRYDPNIYHRRSIRLKNHSYTEIGAYFITICTYQKQRLFGNIKNGKMQLNSLGAIATHCWQEIPNHFSHIQLDVFVIMPNHLHGILWISDDSKLEAKINKLRNVTAGSIPNVVRCYKAAVTKHINQICQQKALNNIRSYILNNPLNWCDDQEYLASTDILLDLPF